MAAAQQDDSGADPNRAEAVTRLAAGVADRIDRRKPFFLWVHYIDPHWPYSPPPPFRDRFQGDRFFDRWMRNPVSQGKARQEMMEISEGRVVDGHDDLAFYVARYDAEIAYTNARIGKLLAALRAKGLIGKTLTVLTADHGESLGEHRCSSTTAASPSRPACGCRSSSPTPGSSNPASTATRSSSSTSPRPSSIRRGRSSPVGAGSRGARSAGACAARLRRAERSRRQLGYRRRAAAATRRTARCRPMPASPSPRPATSSTTTG